MVVSVATSFIQTKHPINNWGNLTLYNEEIKVLKGLIMKTIIATTFALVIATTASANWNTNNGAKWNGDVGTLHTNGCQFKEQTNGTMTLNKATGKWTTTTAASIKVKSTNVNNIKVTQGGNQLYLTSTSQPLGKTLVDYKNGGVASAVATNAQNGAVNINTNEISLGNANKPGATVTTFTIGGTAQMDDLGDLDNIDNNADVYIQHNVTCLQ
jgi:hypothetical protein